MEKPKILPSEKDPTHEHSVEQFPTQPMSSLTEELNKLLSILKASCPEKAIITLDFDGQLHVHIDVHNLEEILNVETILPTLGAGIFHDLVRGDTPHHPFMNRLSAVVNR